MKPNQKLNNREFIARHHRGALAEGKVAVRRRFGISLRLFFAFLYLIFSCAAVVVLQLDRMTMLIALGIFLLAAFLTFASERLFGTRFKREREKELLRGVVEGSRGGRLITDGNDFTVYANQRLIDLCKPFGEPSLQNLIKLFVQDAENDPAAHFRTLADEAYRGLTDSAELLSVEEERDIWYRIIAQPIAGYPRYIHWRVDDITQKRAAERAIRDDREKLIDFTDNAPVGFFSVDEEGRFVFVNATLARWVGDDIQTMLERSTLHTYLVDPPVDAHPYDILSTGGAKQMADLQMKGPGGRTFTASISQAVVHETDGAVRTRAVVHDLTTERAMRLALQASEDRFLRFFEEAPLGIALLDSQGMLDDCNPALASMLGYRIEELEGKHFEALAHVEDRQEAMEALERIMKGRQSRGAIEVTLLGHDKEITAQMYARRLEGSDSIVLHFIDLTEQKALEEQFVQSQKMQAIGQLAGGVAHDFNNLLTAMIGFCDLLLLRHRAGDPSFADIMQIKQNANRAANLVRQLLAFSRQQTLRPKVQDITDILTEVSHLLRRLIGANIELELSHGQDLGLVRVDAGQIEQVLINLAVNARDAMGTGGRVTVRTFAYYNEETMKRGADDMPPGAWVALEVTDTGCGIPEENLTRIFEPFFTTKEVGQGTGLGLATVYGIVRQTGGYLHVDSMVGRGTTFTLYLPRLGEGEAVQERDATDEIENTAGDLTGTALILLVEDEDAVRTFGARALTNKGYEVLEANSGDAALEVLAAHKGRPPDLMITDVIMPGKMARHWRKNCARKRRI